VSDRFAHVFPCLRSFSLSTMLGAELLSSSDPNIA
jgi:hypothetical protein